MYNKLLKKYWKIPLNQIKNSVVLEKWIIYFIQFHLVNSNLIIITKEIYKLVAEVINKRLKDFRIMSLNKNK